MTIGTPTAVVMDGRDAMLAVGMNGEPLPAEHGFPVRMVVPGLYGYVSATKWLVDLELTRFDRETPYWVERGWVPKAPIKTMSRIDTPRSVRRPARPARSRSPAWPGPSTAASTKVEVRVDGGSWAQARLAERARRRTPGGSGCGSGTPRRAATSWRSAPPTPTG